MVPGILFTCYGLRTVPIVSTFVLHDNNKEFLLYNFWGLLAKITWNVVSSFNIRWFLFRFRIWSHVALNGMNFLKSSQTLVGRIVLSSCQLNLLRCSLSTTPAPMQGDFLSPLSNIFLLVKSPCITPLGRGIFVCAPTASPSIECYGEAKSLLHLMT